MKTVLYPNVTTLPSQKIGGLSETRLKPTEKTDPNEFKNLLDQNLKPDGIQSDLAKVKQPLRFSAHASLRLKDREINVTSDLMAKMTKAVDQAAAKGVQDTLVLTKDAAFIVNVPNKIIVTAMNREGVGSNVFTNIDGAVLV